MAYYGKLREALRLQPNGRRYLTRCARCRIFFLCDPRNVNRTDIYCRFGCRTVRSLELGNKRSRKHNATKLGRKTKKKHNDQRRGGERQSSEKKNCPVQSIKEPQRCRPILNHIASVLWIIDGRWYSRDEIWSVISKILRRRSIDKWGLSDYIVRSGRAPPQ